MTSTSALTTYNIENIFENAGYLSLGPETGPDLDINFETDAHDNIIFPNPMHRQEESNL